MKKQRNRFQTKEQEKTQETDLNKMEMSDLPDREFKISHKDAHLGQENNA